MGCCIPVALLHLNFSLRIVDRDFDRDCCRRGTGAKFPSEQSDPPKVLAYFVKSALLTSILIIFIIFLLKKDE